MLPCVRHSSLSVSKVVQHWPPDLIPSQSFVPKQTGEGFSPHVSTGVAPRDYLDKMLAEPFAPFTFSPSGAAIYQLGPFGTAAKKLKESTLKP